MVVVQIILHVLHSMNSGVSWVCLSSEFVWDQFFKEKLCYVTCKVYEQETAMFAITIQVSLNYALMRMKILTSPTSKKCQLIVNLLYDVK